ncbi:outer membrane protein assembly factor BamB family protein [Halomicrobium urmianum]|uniref:outer membrane protein assembly factor BamB family protein n=1 Tax=Halomicrobium urmianum TaxID=1586233 RepID=UPI001CDA0223|nr:PQQ-binding-like beta-propeller repeat protein [Halomicrobium urmianum]
MLTTDRRRFLAAVAASAVPLASGCTAPTAEQSDGHPIADPVTEWPTFRGSRFNTGYARGVEPTGPEPTVAWTYEASGPFWGSPVVAEDAVFIGGTDGALYALDAETGDRQWAFATDHRVEGAPAYADGTVYVGSYDTRVYAVDAASGEERWNRALGGLIRGSPTVRDDTVFIGVGCHNLACSWYADEADVTQDGWVYALDAASGETRWKYPVGDEVVSTPAVDEGTVYVGASDATMYALAADTGDVEWTYDVNDMIWSSPALAFGTLFFADWNGRVHAVDADSGEEEWTADPLANYISGSVAVDEEGVYVGHTPYNSLDDPQTHYGKMFKFDRRTGAELWSFETTALEIGSSPVVTEERLYFGTHGQTERDGLGVYALSTSGEEEWFLEVGARGVGSSPALIDGTLYFGGTDGSVYAVE